jgi:Zn-dependent protease with chaperone function
VTDAARGFPADYFDGVSSARRAVEVTRDGDLVHIQGDGASLTLAMHEVRVQPRVGRTPLRIDLPGGALLLAAADDVEPVLGIPPARGLAHRLETHLGVVLASLAGVALAAWVGVRFGIPWAAENIAMHIPPEVEHDIAQEGLKQLDEYAFKPTALPAQRQAELRKLFAQLRERAGGAAADARLEFRGGGWIGANAFALPGGVVVATDELVNLEADDGRIAAVLSHELGHLDHRHGSRQILQSSMVGLLSAALAGDASTLTTVAVGLPTMLVYTGYSRDFEREADRFAYGLLRETGRSPRLLGEALSQLENARSGPSQECHAEGAAESDAPKRPRPRLGYLSTHPDTAERIHDAEEAAK